MSDQHIRLAVVRGERLRMLTTRFSGLAKSATRLLHSLDLWKHRNRYFMVNADRGLMRAALMLRCRFGWPDRLNGECVWCEVRRRYEDRA